MAFKNEEQEIQSEIDVSSIKGIVNIFIRVLNNQQPCTYNQNTLAYTNQFSGNKISLSPGMWIYKSDGVNMFFEFDWL